MRSRIQRRQGPERALTAAVTTNEAASVITLARLRNDVTSSARRAGKFVTDTLANLGLLYSADGLVKKAIAQLWDSAWEKINTPIRPSTRIPTP